MPHSKLHNANKGVLATMVATLLFAEVLTAALSASDAQMLLQESQPLPFGLPEHIAGHPLVQFSQCLGLNLGGLLLAFLPASLSRKYILICGLALLITAYVMTAFASSIFEVACWRFLVGVGWCMHTCAWISIGATYFPRQCGLVVGCSIFIAGVAWIITPFLPLSLSDVNGWHAPVWWLACIVVLLLVLLFLLLIRMFKGASAQARLHLVVADAPDVALSVWSAAPLALLLASLCMFVATFGVLNFHEEYLREVLNFPVKTVMLIMNTLLIATLLAPVGGWLLDRYGRYTILMTALPLTGAIGGTLFAGWEIPLSAQVLLTLLASVGVSAVLYVGCLAAFIQSQAPSRSLRATGIFMIVGSLSVFFLPAVFLYLQSNLGWLLTALLCITGNLFFATVLVWVAKKKLQGKVHFVHSRWAAHRGYQLPA